MQKYIRIANGESEESSESEEEEADESDVDGEAPPPEGDCVILYSKCGYRGQWATICDREPEITIPIKSLYVPEGLVVRLYNLPDLSG